jgi:hydrogenase maturation protein HypF
VPIQHHEAHVAACLVDNGWSSEAGPVIGVAWDGTGYGRDGRIWGGEFFVGDYRGFRRLAHLEYLPLPGGEAAIRHPWRLALGYVYALASEVPALPGIPEEEARIVRRLVEQGLNTPLTSAAGRLFDAVAALAGVRQHVSYEAQAAIELEMLATEWAEGARPGDLPGYLFDLEEADDGLVVRLGALLAGLRADLSRGTDPGQVGWRFHRTLADLIVAVCRRLSTESTREEVRSNGFSRVLDGRRVLDDRRATVTEVATRDEKPAASIGTVVLTGGCFQNRLLLSLAVPALAAAGFRVLLHRQTPCNDGCVSLGQVALAHFADPELEGRHDE